VSLPWNTEISTLNYPAFKGAGGNALGWKDLIKIDKNVQQAQLIASSSGVSFAGATFFLCVIGAINPVLLPVCATAVIVVTVATTLVFSPQIINLIGRYFQRNDAMNNGNWFVWSNGVGFFNGFGDVDQRWINPSLFNAADRAQMRVGVVFSNVLLNQGPDFDLLKRGAAAGAAHARRGAAAQADARFRRLAALVRKLRRSHGRTRTGTRRDERLFGGPRDDYLFGARGRDSLFGRGGDDVLLQGARGNDRIYGGPGDDNIDGHRGGDILGGGPGNDQLVDFFGAAIVRTGSGKDLVVVRDGRRGDTVVCRGPGRKRILADPGDRIVGTISGSARAVGARGCPAGSRVITSGPLPRLGRGY
jgi:hypothetical protein